MRAACRFCLIGGTGLYSLLCIGACVRLCTCGVLCGHGSTLPPEPYHLSGAGVEVSWTGLPADEADRNIVVGLMCGWGISFVWHSLMFVWICGTKNENFTNSWNYRTFNLKKLHYFCKKQRLSAVFSKILSNQKLISLNLAPVVFLSIKDVKQLKTC